MKIKLSGEENCANILADVMANAEERQLTNMDETFDFVVVGSGGGSMCAGLFMCSVGKTVIILEKTDLVGGTTSRSGGVMWIPNNRFMARDGIPDSEQQAITYLDTLIGESEDAENAPGATRERRLTYIAEAPKMVDFLVEHGVRLTRIKYWPDYYDDKPGGCEPGRTVIAELFNVNELGTWAKKLRPSFIPVQATLDEAFEIPMFKYAWRGRLTLTKVMLRALWAKLTGKHWVTAGAALQGRMLQAALKAEVDIRSNAGVKELIVENGHVVGVVTTKGGRDRRIGARLGVLVNAGGIGQSQRLRDRYLPNTRSEWSNTAEGDTGEMIEEMERIGASLAQMGERVGHQIARPPNHQGLNPMVQLETAKPHSIVVDQTGVRFTNEACSYMEFCKNQLKRHETAPAIPARMILDSRYINRFMLAGSLAGPRKPREWYESGFLQRGNTIEALAQACNLDPATLKATVDRFNGFVRNGRDEEFHRGGRAYDRYLGDPLTPSGTLGVIEQAPFYAVQILPGDVGTFGGVVTDSSARVLREDGSVIPGLYATGNSTASVMGPVYPGAGASIGPSFTWGFVAAKHAAHAENTAGSVAT